MRRLLATAVVGLLAAGCWYLWMDETRSEPARKEDNQPDAPETMKKSEPPGQYIAMCKADDDLYIHVER